MSRWLTDGLLLCLLFLVGCQDPVILIQATRQKGYLGGVDMRVCDPMDPKATYVPPEDQYCTQDYNIFPAVAEGEEEVLEQEVAVFFDDPPAEIELSLYQQAGKISSGALVDSQCNLLFMVLDGQARPVRFTLTFHADTPPSHDCQQAVCPKEIRDCPY